MTGTRRLVIVGGGPTGLSAARGYRDAGGGGDVTLLTPERDLPYQRPPLSKEYLRGHAGEAELPLEPPGWYAEHGIAVRLGTEATALDPGARVVTAGGVPVPFDVCVLATGAQPAPLPVPGGDDPRVLHLRSVASARTLRERAGAARRAIVVGAGFIGCEAAASLAMRGVAVTLIAQEDVPHAPRLGDVAGRRIQAWLEEHGVSLVLGAAVEAIEDGARVRAGGRELEADLVLVAGGIRPCAGLAEAAGVRCADGRVVVDEHMRSSHPGILAAGDVARAFNAAAGRHLAVEHWGEALAMGEVAGRTAAGDRDAAWAQAPGFWSTIGERTLKYAAWGDGFDTARLEEDGNGFTVWYGRGGACVGVLAHERDEDYERGRELVERGAPMP